MAILPPVQTGPVNAAPASSNPPFYRALWVQVQVARALAIVMGYVDPARAVAMKPLGDAFIRVITMIITLIIFCTVVTGIAGMENLKEVGRVVVRPSSGFNVNVATLDAKSVADYAGQAKARSLRRAPTN